MVWLATGLLVLVLILSLSRVFLAMRATDLARAVRTFIAVFSGLAGTGLLFFGRIGLAVIALSAAFMAVRSLVAAGRPPDPLNATQAAGGAAGAAGVSTVETRLLRMRLDRATGSLAGEVLAGPQAGRSLAALTLPELVALRTLAVSDDPPAVALLETYLDRAHPTWRATDRRHHDGPAASPSADPAMDERMALEILGLAPGASAEEVKAAHRRLMAGVHPDHGGSTWLASRINAARELLLRGRA